MMRTLVFSLLVLSLGLVTTEVPAQCQGGACRSLGKGVGWTSLHGPHRAVRIVNRVRPRLRK